MIWIHIWQLLWPLILNPSTLILKPLLLEVAVPTGELLICLCLVMRETVEVDVARALAYEPNRGSVQLTDAQLVPVHVTEPPVVPNIFDAVLGVS